MKKTIRNTLVIGCTLLLLLFLWIAVSIGLDMCGIVLPWHRDSAVECTLLWGGLAPFPADPSELDISTAGSPFTRTFLITFSSTKDAVESWIRYAA